MSRTVLVVDDEPSIRKVLSQYLVSEGHRVLEAATGAEALQHLGLLGGQGSGVDLVLLDLGLPDIDGLEVLSTIRRSQTVYVMVLTARAEEVDKLVGLNVGADDYVTKPFSVREVAARIKAVFRRLDAASRDTHDEDVLRLGDLVIDRAAREVHLAGTPVELSALDFDLLTALAERPGRGYDFYGDERVVDVHIRTMRKALDDDPVEPRFIATVRGVGYKFLPLDSRH
jgi:DNA-binding response OmpR family regulator